MTDYLKKSFSVAAPGTDEYRENWDRIFGQKEKIREIRPGVFTDDVTPSIFIRAKLRFCADEDCEADLNYGATCIYCKTCCRKRGDVCST